MVHGVRTIISAKDELEYSVETKEVEEIPRESTAN